MTANKQLRTITISQGAAHSGGELNIDRPILPTISLQPPFTERNSNSPRNQDSIVNDGVEEQLEGGICILPNDS